MTRKLTVKGCFVVVVVSVCCCPPYRCGVVYYWAMTAAVKSCARPLATWLLRGRTTGAEGGLPRGSATTMVASLQVVMEAPFPVGHGRTTELARLYSMHITREELGESVTTRGHRQSERKRKFTLSFFVISTREFCGNRLRGSFSSFFPEVNGFRWISGTP